MAKYAEEIAIIFDNLESEQISSIIKELDREEIIIFSLEILPYINPCESRNYLRNILAERYPNAPKTTQSSSDLLALIHSKTIQAIFNTTVQIELLQKISKEELFFLLASLNRLVKNNNLVLAIKKQLDTKYPDIWPAEYLRYWKKQESHSNPLIWADIIDKINILNAVKVVEPPKIQQHQSFFSRFIQWIKGIGNYINRLFNSIFNIKIKPIKQEKTENKQPFTVEISEEDSAYFSAMKTSGREYADASTGKSIFGNVQRSIEDREASAKTRIGITLSSQVTACSSTDSHYSLTKVASSLIEAGDSKEDNKIILNAMQSNDKDNPFNNMNIFFNYGDDAIACALEMQEIQHIADNPEILSAIGLNFSEDELIRINTYKANLERSRSLNYAIAEFSLCEGGYDIKEALKKQNKREYKLKTAPKKFLAANKTRLEIIEAALAGKDFLSQCVKLKYGQKTTPLNLELDGKKVTIQIKRSKTKAGCEYTVICDPPFGLTPAEYAEMIKLKSQDKPIDEARLTQLEQLNENGIENLSLAVASKIEDYVYKTERQVLSKKVLSACAELSEGQSLYLDTGCENHAMKISIKMNGDQFTFSCYDSAGSLEFRSLEQTSSNHDFYYYARSSNALTFSIKRDRLISAEGLEYFSNLISLHTFASWAETNIKKQQTHINYIEKFTAIAGGPKSAKFDSLLQRPQNANNCFAKRLQTCQLYELGKPTYKRLRAAVLLHEKQELINDICGAKGELPLVHQDYILMLKNIRPEFISPNELHELSRQLSEVNSTPSKEYYIKYFQSLMDAHEKMMQDGYEKNKLVIKRIENKIETYAKSYYAYLKQSQRPKEDFEAVFSDDFDGNTFNWRIGRFPIKVNALKFEEKALNILADYANAQAWKAAIQFLNHQIIKLSANERYIKNDSERLSKASLEEIKKATTNDIIGANIITFVTGPKRSENIRIELNLVNERKEIDINTFFGLILRNNELLTNPKVISLLEYLRNCSRMLEKKFFKEIYPAQHTALINKLSSKIKETTNNLMATVDILIKYEHDLNLILTKCDAKLIELDREIAAEISLLGPDKESLKLKNAKALRELIISKDKPNLEQLKLKIAANKGRLLGEHSTAGSPNHLIAQALDTLKRIDLDDGKLENERKIINDFIIAQNNLENLAFNLKDTIQAVEVDNFEQTLTDRQDGLNDYRTKVITECLKINSQYKILVELSSFKIGTQRDITPRMFDKANPRNKIGYIDKSLLSSIHNLNSELRRESDKIFEQRIILRMSKPSTKISDLIDTQADYDGIVKQAEEFITEDLPAEIKEKWVKEMFNLWLKHEQPETILALLKDKIDEIAAINLAFHQFIERHTNIKLAALKDANYPIDLTLELIQSLGWQKSNLTKIEETIAKREQGKKKLLEGFRTKKVKRASLESVTERMATFIKPETEQLKPEMLNALHDSSSIIKTFYGPKVEFLSQSSKAKLSTSTLTFLRNHKIPSCADKKVETCTSYFANVTTYLNELNQNKNLENKNERIMEFCFSASAIIFTLPYLPPKELISELRITILNQYKDPHAEPGKEFYKAFATLENNQRSQILSTLIKLTLIEIAADQDQPRKVSNEFYSMIKQWERLISPPDRELSEALSIDKLTPNGVMPIDFNTKPKEFLKSAYILKAVDEALHNSPVSLEGLYEGQKGLQRALATYATAKGLTSDVRSVADRLAMRNGDSLLAHQFINYFNNPRILLSNDKGINSTPGREFFSRALIDAYHHANQEERIDLLKFLDNLNFEEESCKLKVPHQIFCDGLLIQCKNIEIKTFDAFIETREKSARAIGASIEKFIQDATNKDSKSSENRLFGFAKEINYLAEEIARVSLTPDDNLDKLYSQLICAKLAYQLLIDKATDEELINLNENLEYLREMALVQANINKLQDNLVDFSMKLTTGNAAAIFKATFTQYQAAKKFSGTVIKITQVSSSEIPGFINLKPGTSIDILHGAIYIGNSKQGVVPTYIKSHFSLQILGMNEFPFKKVGDSYVYMEEDTAKKLSIKGSITPLANGELVIQRELKNLDGENIMLQYLEPEHSVNLPAAIKSSINIEHFFIDKDNIIHAFSHDFNPQLKLAPTNVKGTWRGEVIDHNGEKISFKLEGAPSETELSTKLAKLIPIEEILTINANTIYIPALKQYIKNEEGKLYIVKNLSPEAERSEITISDNGVGNTKKVRSKLEEAKVLSYKQEILKLEKELGITVGKGEEIEIRRKLIKDKIKDYQQKIIPEYFMHKLALLEERLAKITKKDIISLQQKLKIQTDIEECKEKIRQIETPHYFIFIAESILIKKQKALCERLKDEMSSAFSEFKGSSPIEREVKAAIYNKAKSTYLKNITLLREIIAETNHLISFNVDKNSKLIANDFQSILHIGKDLKKIDIFIEMLSKNIPNTPLTKDDLENLQEVTNQYLTKEPIEKQKHAAYCMLLGVELQHYILEREQALLGRKANWDRESYEKIKALFSKQIQILKREDDNLLLKTFSELWREIHAEFHEDSKVIDLFAPIAIPPSEVTRRPLNINTKTTNMPIETIEAQELIQFTPHKDFNSLIDKTQRELAARLQQLDDKESIQAQEDGYYYENYGLFNLNTINKLFKLSLNKAGIGKLSAQNISDLFTWLEKQGFIAKLAGCDDKYQLLQHPSVFFSAPKVAGFLSEMGLKTKDAQKVIDRLEVFMYETAVNGGKYEIIEGAGKELLSKLDSIKDKFNIEFLQAQDKIKSILSKASEEITFTELHSAYLLNDYRFITQFYPSNDRAQIETVLNNALTRMLFYKTELIHLNEIHTELTERNNIGKAIAMLHIRRNYKLDKLLGETQDLPPEQLQEIEKDKKMQRAFLLFESVWEHRCNANQVDIFRGLLLDDETDPDKIDAAQARMGFGKTSLLPLIALYKTGNKLVRFIVPKSALETNTADMSLVLTKILGKRAIKDDFYRYKIEKDDENNLGEDSPLLKSLQDAKADLIKRLVLYKETIANREVLVQAPHVRNAIECQAEIFLDLLLKITDKPEQEKELMECIALINEIRSLTTISIFDELDATQDPLATDVNYTSGEKEAIDPDEIIPLEIITLTLRSSRDKKPEQLAEILLAKFKIKDEEGKIKLFIINQDKPLDVKIKDTDEKAIYLMRAILSDHSLINLFREKEPCTDFGVWFQNTDNGDRLYDYSSLSKDKSVKSTEPLLIAVPYSAANTPKPQGSRFDNPEVTAITTFLYYLDSRTAILEEPHLEFIINAIRKGIKENPFLDFPDLFEELKEIATKVDPRLRNEARTKFFNTKLNLPDTQQKFRKILARTIIQEQIKIDSGKANSNRYEQGTVNDSVIGFSGTAGDTSSHFNNVHLDAAADGNMSLGIMGRANCQKTIALDTTSVTQGSGYTSELINQLAKSFTKNTRTLIDVGGLCKASNREVAKAIAIVLQQKSTANNSIKNNGVIFYDNNVKKLLTLNLDGSDTVVLLNEDMVKKSESEGRYFTFYDQDHCRGADIKQMNKAEAILTLNFTVTNNKYKQAIMRMRKIIDKTAGQSFSVAVPQILREKILEDLGKNTLGGSYILTGNDIACWLRDKELKENTNNVFLIKKELEAEIKNAIIQQQAALTKLITANGLDNISPDKIAIFRQCIKELNTLSPMISSNESSLKAKYGSVYGLIKREVFLSELEESFNKKLKAVFEIVNHARTTLNIGGKPLPKTLPTDPEPYQKMALRIIEKRKKGLSEELHIQPTTEALTESHAEVEAENEAEAEAITETETHAFAQVNSEEAVVTPTLNKDPTPYQPLSIDFIKSDAKLSALSMAHNIKFMSLLFSNEDPISCSPSYDNQPIPPVRYFLAREEGKPKIILINQDEADLFKKSVNSDWTLYNVTLQKGQRLTPITGTPINLTQDQLYKKILFASFRSKITNKSLRSIEDSLSGLYTHEQLEPALTINYHEEDNKSLFSFDKWGFSGDKPQKIDVSVSRVHDKLFKEKHEKYGVQIKLQGQEKAADIFISAKLKPLIKAEIAARKQETNPSKEAILEKVRDNIKTEYQKVMDKKIAINAEIGAKIAEKTAIIDDTQKAITRLIAEKEAAIARVKHSLETSFGDKIKDYLYLRAPISELMSRDIDYFNKPINVQSKKYDTLDLAIKALCDKHLASLSVKDAVYTSRQLQEKLELIVTTLTPIVHQNYKIISSYDKTSGAFIDYLKTKLDAKYKSSPGTFLLYDLKTDTNFINAFDLNFCEFYHSDDERAKLLECFAQAINDSLSRVEGKGTGKAKKHVIANEFNPELLEGAILKHVTALFKKADKSEDELYLFTSRLSYTLNTGGPAKHQDAIKKEVEDRIRNILIMNMESHADSNQSLSIEAVRYLKSKLGVEFDLPESLTKFMDLDESTLIPTIQETLARQNIRVSDYQLRALKEEISYQMDKYRQINRQIFDDYAPITNRTGTIHAEGAAESKSIPPDILESIRALDIQVAKINQDIEDAKKQRDEQVASIDTKIRTLKKERIENKTKIKERKMELSAINKLFRALSNLFAVFLDNKVEINKNQTPAQFLEQNFSLEKVVDIIDDEALADKIPRVIDPIFSATLTFSPPEYYDATHDMAEQKVRLHGLTDSENQVGRAFDLTDKIVRTTAHTIQDREHEIALQGVLQPRQKRVLESAEVVEEDESDIISETYNPDIELDDENDSSTLPHSSEDEPLEEATKGIRHKHH